MSWARDAINLKLCNINKISFTHHDKMEWVELKNLVGIHANISECHNTVLNIHKR
jgi:hypothetical protein